MFDRITVQTGRKYPERVDVHEHRAPTDDSIRIYREMREKAERELLQVTELRDNTFNYTLHVFEDPAHFGRRAVFRWVLNGKPYECSLKLPSTATSARDIATAVHKALTEEIARIITVELMLLGETRARS